MALDTVQSNHYKEDSMKRIICPSIGDAIYLSLALEHEGHATIWLMEGTKAVVATLAPTHAVKAAIDSFPTRRAS